MTSVQIDEHIDLSKLVQQSDDPTSKNAVYELFGIVDHMGSLNGGHYVSRVRNPDDQNWYNFNDSQVSRARLSFPEDSSSAYILFYKKMEPSSSY